MTQHTRKEIRPQRWPGQADWPVIVRYIRDTRHWTQAEFAEILGVSARSVQEWEYGTTTPRAKSRRALMTYWEAV